MNCVEFNQNIKKFITNDMEIDDLNKFLIHLKSCDECKEELEIRYLVEKTLVELDNDTDISYDLGKSLKSFIFAQKDKVDRHLRFVKYCVVLWGTSFSITILMMIYFWLIMM